MDTGEDTGEVAAAATAAEGAISVVAGVVTLVAVAAVTLAAAECTWAAAMWVVAECTWVAALLILEGAACIWAEPVSVARPQLTLVVAPCIPEAWEAAPYRVLQCTETWAEFALE